ncbi:MAG: hypothetical protein ACRDO2_03305, partial [Nocardioidaceae bacterium]
DADLDPHLLMWDIRRNVRIDLWPRARTVVAFHLDDVPAKSAGWWLIVNGGEADVCDYDPGYEVSATVQTSLRTLTEFWRGDVSWTAAVRAGAVEVRGDTTIRRAIPDWLGRSGFAAVPRPA